jgi:hypothetical protein
MNRLTTSTAIPTRALKLEALANISASFELFCLAQPGTFADPLTEVLRNGARALLAQAVEAEVAALLSGHADKRTVANGWCATANLSTPKSIQKLQMALHAKAKA